MPRPLQPASQRFISALRALGTDGRIIEWAWDRSWHNTVVIDSNLVDDWTVSQFDPALTDVQLSSRAQTDPRMLTDYVAAAGILIDPEDKFLSRRVDPWQHARQRIPVSELDAQAFATDP